MSPDKLSAGSGSGSMGGGEKPPETKKKRAVSQPLSFKGSVFGKMLADETAPLWAPYLSTINKMYRCAVRGTREESHK